MPMSLNFSLPFNEEARIRREAIARGESPDLAVAQARSSMGARPSSGVTSSMGNAPTPAPLDISDEMSAIDESQEDQGGLLSRLFGIDTSGMNYGGMQFGDRLMGAGEALSALGQGRASRTPQIIQAGREQGAYLKSMQEKAEQRRQALKYIAKTGNKELLASYQMGMDPTDIIKYDLTQKNAEKERVWDIEDKTTAFGRQKELVDYTQAAQSKYAITEATEKARLEQEASDRRYTQIFGEELPPSPDTRDASVPQDRAQPIPEPMPEPAVATATPQPRSTMDMLFPNRRPPPVQQDPRSVPSMFPPQAQQPPQPPQQQPPQPQIQLPQAQAQPVPLPLVSPATERLRERFNIPWLRDEDTMLLKGAYASGKEEKIYEAFSQIAKDKAERDKQLYERSHATVSEGQKIVDFTTDPANPKIIFENGAQEPADIRTAKILLKSPKELKDMVLSLKRSEAGQMSPDDKFHWDLINATLPEEVKNLVERGIQLNRSEPDMQALEAIVDSDELPEGPGWQSFMSQFVPGYSNAADAMKAIIFRNAPSLRVANSGSTSDLEYKGMLASFPTLWQTKEGRKAILSVMMQSRKMERKQVELARQLKSQQISPSEYEEKSIELSNQSLTESIPDELKATIKKAGKTGGAVAPPMPQSAKDAGITEDEWNRGDEDAWGVFQ